MNRIDDGSLPGFSDSVVKIARILQQDVLMLVDDLDALTQHDQNALFDAFRDVIDYSACDSHKGVCAYSGIMPLQRAIRHPCLCTGSDC